MYYLVAVFEEIVHAEDHQTEVKDEFGAVGYKPTGLGKQKPAKIIGGLFNETV